MKLKATISSLPWYAVLVAIYPPLALLAHNIGEIKYSDAYRALLVSAVAAVLLLLCANRILHNWHTAGAVTAVALLFFYTYGPIHSSLQGAKIHGLIVGRHLILAPAWALLCATCLLWVMQHQSWLPGLNAAFSVTALTMNLFAGAQLVYHEYQLGSQPALLSADRAIHGLSVPPGGAPDIYFIILDMYGRSDVLREDFNYDDSAFLNELREQGFYVASCSRSNYPSTTYSLAATLNLDYVDRLLTPEIMQARSITPLRTLMANNAVKATLRGLGYKIVTFETGYAWAEMHDADVFYSAPQNGLSDFEYLLLRNSALLPLYDGMDLVPYHLTGDYWKYRLVLNQMDTLAKIPSLPGPKFVFVHLVVPHPYFVFGPDGAFQVVSPRYFQGEVSYPRESFISGYRNQVAFLGSRLPDLLRTIIQRSARPPIIIMQGDHGPRYVSRPKQVDNLSVYYLPGRQSALYDSLTPVNNFRIVFSSYFGAALPDLPDKSYLVGSGTFDFSEVPEQCTPAK